MKINRRKHPNPKFDEWVRIYIRMTFVDRYGTYEKEGIPDESGVCLGKFFKKLDKEYTLKRKEIKLQI